MRHAAIMGVLLAMAGFIAISDSHGRGFGGGGGGRGGGGGGRGGGGGAYRGGGAAVGPHGGAGYGTRSGGTVVGPGGGSASRGSGSGSYTTGRGTTIDYAGAGRGVTGPRGGTAGRAVGGVEVTTPGGRTATKVGQAGGAVGPGGVAVGGRSSIGAATGPRGAAVGVSGGRTAIGPGGAVHGGYRGGVAVGPHGAGAAVSRTGVAVAGRGTYHVTGAAMRTQATSVRLGFTHYNTFTRGWYAKYPGAWVAAGWVAGRAWAVTTWGAVSSYCAYPAEPVYYDYGTTVVYEGDTVYVNGEQTATTEEYSKQATQLAETGREAKPPEKEEWQPLGVFAMVKGEEQNSDKIFELAISKDGVMRGNYYDAFADNTLPVYGSVDKKTQRAAWSIGDKKDVVFEAGIANLTRDETPVLAHFGKDNTQQFTLVRIQKAPETGEQGQ